jgi:hypothetical protein
MELQKLFITLEQMEAALWAQYIAMGGQIPEGMGH